MAMSGLATAQVGLCEQVDETAGEVSLEELSRTSVSCVSFCGCAMLCTQMGHREQVDGIAAEFSFVELWRTSAQSTRADVHAFA